MDPKRKKYIQINVIISLVALVILSSLYLFFVNKTKDIYEENKEEIIAINEARLEAIEIEEEIDSYDGEYEYLNHLNFDLLDDTSFVVKYEDDNYKVLVGIDISEFNGAVNFYKLKEAGIDFIMLRVGWRGYTEGGLYEDKFFEDYYKEAKDAGLLIGYYIFSQAINEEEVKEEAEFILNKVKDKQCDLFLTFDMESVSNSEGRIFDLTRQERTELALKFVEIIKENGYKPMIYANKDWATNYYFMKEFKDVPVWFAQYGSYPDVNFPYLMYQYTNKATVSGSSLRGTTDLNLMLLKK